MNLAERTHPRTSGLLVQLAVLAAAVLLGLGIGGVLLLADQRSWDGARTATAVVTGLGTKGIEATADGRAVVLHLERVPRTGSKVEIELSPDGRARPLSYKQTAVRATRSGVALSVLLVVLVQGYRFAVTRRD